MKESKMEKSKKRMFRLLTASEMDCRVSTVKENGFSILLYKDARCDMNILDETVSPMGWKREHLRDNANCVVSLWDEEKKQWISKEDTGTESFTEKAKGLASDSFKRACFNWGIGRELYTAPFIWINAEAREVFKKNDGKFTTYAKMRVQTVVYNEKGEISSLVIIDKAGNVRHGSGKAKAPVNEASKELLNKFNNANSLEELKMLWDSLSIQEKFQSETIKENRKKIILNFKKK